MRENITPQAISNLWGQLQNIETRYPRVTFLDIRQEDEKSLFYNLKGCDNRTGMLVLTITELKA